MENQSKKSETSRRELFKHAGKTMAAALTAPAITGPLLRCAAAEEGSLHAIGGVDRVTMLTGKTYLRGWAGYGDAPKRRRRYRHDGPESAVAAVAPQPSGPEPKVMWSKVSGPGKSPSPTPEP